MPRPPWRSAVPCSSSLVIADGYRAPIIARRNCAGGAAIMCRPCETNDQTVRDRGARACSSVVRNRSLTEREARVSARPRAHRAAGGACWRRA
jgi:hypothetical protein